MDWIENKRKWNSFLSPLRSSRRDTWGGSSRIQIKNKIPGTHYLSQTFANKLLENIKQLIPVKGRSEELRKVAKNFQQTEVLGFSSNTPFSKGQFPRTDSEGQTGSSRDGKVFSSRTAITTADSGLLLNRNDDAIKIEDIDNQDQWKRFSMGVSTFPETDQINVELLDNSRENPIAISDDESTEETTEEIKCSSPKKRKQDNFTAIDSTEVSPQKRTLDGENSVSTFDLRSIPAIENVDVDLKKEIQWREQQNPGASVETKRIGDGDRIPEGFVLETGKPSLETKWDKRDEKSAINASDTKRSPITFLKQDEVCSPDWIGETHILADVSAQQLASLEKEYSIERPRMRAERSPNKKDDIDKPCSQWNMDLFARYFDFERTVDPEELNLEQRQDLHELHVDQMISEFKRRINIASSTVKYFRQENEETLNFESLCRTEVGTRLILNEIFFPLCSCLDLSVEIERNIDCSYLPNCKFDYRIVNTNGEVIGAVEAKSARSLKPDSVVQAVLELCILQTERLTRRANNEELKNKPLFNVLTDGMRYVFIVLQGGKLHFEQSFNKIRVREMTSWDNVENLYKSLLHLMRLQDHVANSPDIVEL